MRGKARGMRATFLTRKLFPKISGAQSGSYECALGEIQCVKIRRGTACLARASVGKKIAANPCQESLKRH